jgi:heme oxygenase
VRQVSKTLVRLNVETRNLHAAADAPWLDLVGPLHSVTRLDYVSQLVLAYGFDSPLEAALAYTPHLNSFIGLHARFRGGLLAQDLLALGVKPAEVASLRQCMIAPFASVAEAFGWLYVHQRSTLLHEGVGCEIASRLPDVARATTCLHDHDGRVGALWEEFGQALDRVARTSHIEDRILSAALDAFRTLGSWHRRTDAMAPLSKTS